MKTVKVYSFEVFENDNQNVITIWNMAKGESELNAMKEKYPHHEIKQASYDDLNDWCALTNGILDDESIVLELVDGLYKWDKDAIFTEDEYKEDTCYGDYVKVS